MKPHGRPMATSKTRLDVGETLHMGVPAAAGDQYRVETSLWDGAGKGDGGEDLTNYVKVRPTRPDLDGSVYLRLEDEVVGDPTFLTVAEARDLALLLLVVANRAENLAARTNKKDPR